MEDNYSIDEILSAVNDLQNISKDKKFQKNYQINLILQIFQKIHLD